MSCAQLSKSCQKWPNSDFQSEFSMSKIIRIFLKKKIHGRISIWAHLFCKKHFLLTSIFKPLYLLKWCPIFDDSLLHQFTKYNNFLLVYWFLCKNLSNFVYLPWKLNNPNNSTTRYSFGHEWSHPSIMSCYSEILAAILTDLQPLLIQN